MEPEVTHKWIPWERYVFILNIDDRDIPLGRHRRIESIRREAEELSVYKGYFARIIDTRKNLTILFNNGWIKFKEEPEKTLHLAKEFEFNAVNAGVFVCPSCGRVWRISDYSYDGYCCPDCEEKAILEERDAEIRGEI